MLEALSHSENNYEIILAFNINELLLFLKLYSDIQSTGILIIWAPSVDSRYYCFGKYLVWRVQTRVTCSELSHNVITWLENQTLEKYWDQSWTDIYIFYCLVTSHSHSESSPTREKLMKATFERVESHIYFSLLQRVWNIEDVVAGWTDALSVMTWITFNFKACSARIQLNWSRIFNSHGKVRNRES